ncbi:unnamed protein product [Amoebophrya sp. A120]|nr:unnamed protein product [Amoebophrya sp. A120]|eukprot:GSA120T00010300001.1
MSPKWEARWTHCKLQRGDLILGMGPSPSAIVSCAAMNDKGAKAMINQLSMSCYQQRPIYLERRRVRRDEIIVIFEAGDETKEQKTPEYKQLLKTAGNLFKKHMTKIGLFFVNDNQKPPRALKDMHHKSWWTDKGVEAGAKLVLVNGVNVEALTFKMLMQQFGTFFAHARPLSMVWRTSATNSQNVVADHLQREEQLMLKQVYKLDGSIDTKEILLKKMGKVGIRWPRVYLTMRRMNFRPVRARRLDVQGVATFGTTHAQKHQKKGEQEAIIRDRVPGTLEDHVLEQSRWQSVNMFRGEAHAGNISMTSRILYKDMRPHRQSRSVLAAMFNSQQLRDMHAEVPPQVRVRIYVIRATGMEEGMRPMLYFRFGDDVKRYESLLEAGQLSSTNPIFYRVEERDIVFPHEARLEVGLFDQNLEDELLGKKSKAAVVGKQTTTTVNAFETMNPAATMAPGATGANGKSNTSKLKRLDPMAVIGSTVIDLEDRWFNPVFQKYMAGNNIPIEYRPLYSLDFQNPKRRGQVEMFVEMLDSERAVNIPAQVLTPPPSTEIEIRVVIWSCRNITMLVLEEEQDEEVSTADLKVKAALDSGNFLGTQPNVQETDIHYMSTGTTEYNWRFCFSNIAVREGFPLDVELSLGIFNARVLGADFMMGEATLDLKQYVTYVAAEQKKIEVNAEIPMTNKKLVEILQARNDAKLAKSEQLRRLGLDNMDTEGMSDRASAMAKARAMKRMKQGPEELNQRLMEELEQENNAIRKQTAAEQTPQRIPPVALATVNVQVLTQAEADQEDHRVGMGRDEPNRDPVLPFPASGRSWDAVLPAAKLLIQAVGDAIEALRSSGFTACYVMVFVVALGCWTYFVDDFQCMYFVQASCCVPGTCGDCSWMCQESGLETNAELMRAMCYYTWMSDEEVIAHCATACGGTCADQPLCSPGCIQAKQVDAAGLTGAEDARRSLLQQDRASKVQYTPWDAYAYR